MNLGHDSDGDLDTMAMNLVSVVLVCLLIYLHFSELKEIEENHV